jgi:HNH endonuclease
MKTQEKRRRIRNYVIARDGAECCYCGEKLEYDQITMEHIVPESKRGTFNSTNLTVACGVCNNRRGNENFFKYAKIFQWNKDKIKKYNKLYLNNLKIKVLNISKEYFLKSDTEIPTNLIKKSCKLLKIKNMDFSNYYYVFNFEESAKSNMIKYNFGRLIKIIELESI